MTTRKEVVSIAIEKFMESKAKKVKSDLEAGSYKVHQRITLEVDGEVVRSEDSTAAPTVKIPYKLVIALLLKRAGVTREASQSLLLSVMNEAMAMEKESETSESLTGSVMAEYVGQVDELELAFKKIVDQMPRMSTKGKTRFNGTVKEVSVEELLTV